MATLPRARRGTRVTRWTAKEANAGITDCPKVSLPDADVVNHPSCAVFRIAIVC